MHTRDLWRHLLLGSHDSSSHTLSLTAGWDHFSHVVVVQHQQRVAALAGGAFLVPDLNTGPWMVRRRL